MLAASFIIALLFSVLAGTVHFSTVQASTEVIGIISSNITFTKANSPYVFKGPIVVNADATLTIEAGVTIDLDGNYLEVGGTLIAKGSSRLDLLQQWVNKFRVYQHYKLHNRKCDS